jgi:hypothetical protein
MSSHEVSSEVTTVRRVRFAGGRHALDAWAGRADRVDVALGAIFLLSAVFYVWTAGTSVPLSLHHGAQDRYNLLASALLHFHLSVGRAPAALLHLADPYNPKLNHPLVTQATDASSVNDDVLYHGQLYFIWGPAPALVLLVPLHLLGFEPSASVTVAVYSIAGLGFALATLRILVRRLEGVPVWMCALAGLTLSLASAIPFTLRTPGISEDILAGGYCFTMAGVWLATAALASRSASLPRLVLMSLCFGLAAGARPALGVCALVLVPVYLGLRASRSRRSLALALGLPIAICFVLLLEYNQARFHEPLEIGTHYQLTGYDSRDAPIGRIGYTLPGTALYWLTPPQPMAVFPFVALNPPTAAFPKGLGAPEITGGLLPTAPIVVFVIALPWLWRRRPARLGGLAPGLMMLALAGLLMMLVVSYEFFASTERYEVDFATLFVLGGLAGWLALATGPPSRRRLLLRVGGGVLAAWSCAAGLAISFIGYGNDLAVAHPSTWRTLEELGAPLSTAITLAVGHPVIAPTFGSLNTRGGALEYVLSPIEQGDLTIVSPSTRTATLMVKAQLLPGSRYEVGVIGPRGENASYPVPKGGGTVALPLRLDSGLNHIALHPVGLSSIERMEARLVLRLTDMSVDFSP